MMHLLKSPDTAHIVLTYEVSLICYYTLTDDPLEQKSWRPNDGLSYVSHVQVDDGMLHLDDEDVYDFKVDFPAYEEPRRQTNMTVSLIDIAKPARRKGDIGFLSGVIRGLTGMTSVRPKKSAMIIQDHDYEFEDFIELDYSDTFSIFSEDWEDVCAGDDDDVRLNKR